MPALEHSAAEVIAQLLIDAGLVTEDQAAVASEPDVPDTCVTVSDTSPIFQGRSMADGQMWEFFGVQVRVRAQRPDAAMRLAIGISYHLETGVYDVPVALDAPVGTGTDRYLVHACRRSSGPIPLGKEQPSSMRSIVTVNLLVSLKQLS